MMSLKMMKKLISSFIFMWFLFGAAATQVKTDSINNELHINFLSFYNYSIPDPLFLNEFDHLKFKWNLSNDTTSIWLQTRLQLPSMLNTDENKNKLQIDILNPLGQKYSTIQSMKTLKYILGTVQVSAVGYLAYLHLKKYGFLKKK